MDESCDRPVGMMDDTLKRVFTAWREMQQAAEQCLFDARFSRSKDKTMQLLVRLTELKVKSETLSEIFWILVKDKFSLWGETKIGVRHGFVIVKIEDDHESGNSFLDLLRKLSS